MFNSLFDSLFDTSLSRRSRFSSEPSITEMNVLDAKAAARQASNDVIMLKQKVERLMMITEALWTILKETTDYTDDDLAEIIREIDLRDGVLDGKVAQETPDLCPNCNRVLQKNKKNCIYCGSEIESNDIFQR